MSKGAWANILVYLSEELIVNGMMIRRHTGYTYSHVQLALLRELEKKEKKELGVKDKWRVGLKKDYKKVCC